MYSSTTLENWITDTKYPKLFFSRLLIPLAAQKDANVEKAIKKNKQNKSAK